MIKKIQTSPVLISTIVLIFCLGVVSGFTIFLREDTFQKDFWLNILVESYGMLFDILVIGILIFWLQRRAEKEHEKKRNIQRYREEIEDYLGWNEREATYRIVGNIKRLYRLGATDIFLARAYLMNADLHFCELFKADLSEANLSNSNLYASILIWADLSRANLEGADLESANLQGANFNEANLRETSLCRADLRGAQNLKLEQVAVATTLAESRLDLELEQLVKENYPHLLKKSVDDQS